MASELGVLPIEPADVLEKGRLQPGKMFLVDTVQGRIVSDDELKSQIAAQRPYGEWVNRNKVDLNYLPEAPVTAPLDAITRARLWRALGYTREDLHVLLGPMAVSELLQLLRQLRLGVGHLPDRQIELHAVFDSSRSGAPALPTALETLLTRAAAVL